MNLPLNTLTDTTNVNGSDQSVTSDPIGYSSTKLKKEPTLEEYYAALQSVTNKPVTYISNGRSYNHSDKELLDFLQQKYIEETSNPLDIREAIELLMENRHVENNRLWNTLSSRS